MTPPQPLHGYVCVNVAAEIRDFARPRGLGRVFGNDTGVVTERDPDTLRGADVAYYSFVRLPPGEIPPRGYFAVVPELVVEVKSPDDRWPAVLTKVGEYLTAGVTAVCVVDLIRRSATVYRSEPEPQRFGEGDELTLPDVLPGLAVPVRRLFE